MVAPENTELLKALDAARAAIKDEEWDDVQKHVDKALAIDGENAAAKQLSQQARDEAENKKHYDELVKASKQKKYASYGVVVSEFDQVKHDSAYRERAREAHDKVKADYQRTTTTQANKLARAKQCDELRQLAVDAGKLWEDVGASIEAIAERCKPRVAVVNPKPDPPKPKPDPPKPKPDPPKRNYDELVSEIRDASKNGQYGRALRRCGDAIKQKRESSTILMCGNAACNLKNEGLARRYMGMLGQEREKLFIRKSCLRAGLTID
jgi:hypothetical protein